MKFIYEQWLNFDIFVLFSVVSNLPLDLHNSSTGRTISYGFGL